jgi:HK97 gp10 family phage protein
MGWSVRINVPGWEQLERDVALGMMHRLGEQILADAQRLVPVDTGRLRASLDMEVQDVGDQVVLRVGSNVEYAAFVETGTSRTRAQPYLAPALYRRRPGF